MSEQLLGRFEVAGRVEDALTGGVPCLVHPFAAGRTGRDDPGPLEAGVPPVPSASNKEYPDFLGKSSGTGPVEATRSEESCLVGLAGHLLDDHLRGLCCHLYPAHGQVQRCSASR